MESEQKIDLDKLRDEKIFPLAETCLDDMADLMFPREVDGKTDMKPIILKILEREKDADLNLTTETTYLFQVMLKYVHALNKAVQSTVVVEIDEERMNEVAKRMFALLKDHTDEEATIVEKMNEIVSEYKLNKFEINYAKDIIFNSFNAVQSSVASSIESSLQQAEEKLIGCKMEEITMGKLDSILKE
jgi:hypothetical protein